MTTPARRTANRYPHLDMQIRAIVRAHAERYGLIVVLCEPGPVELLAYGPRGNPQWAGNTGKICYPDLAAATAAAEEINGLEGADPVVPYGCPRSFHHHLVDWGRRSRTSGRIAALIHAAALRAGAR